MIILFVDIRIELRGTAIVFWGAQEDKEKVEKGGVENEEAKGDCNKEQYFQKVVLLEKGLFNNCATAVELQVNLVVYDYTT